MDEEDPEDSESEDSLSESWVIGLGNGFARTLGLETVTVAGSASDPEVSDDEDEEDEEDSSTALLLRFLVLFLVAGFCGGGGIAGTGVTSKLPPPSAICGNHRVAFVDE